MNYIRTALKSVAVGVLVVASTSCAQQGDEVDYAAARKDLQNFARAVTELSLDVSPPSSGPTSGKARTKGQSPRAAAGVSNRETISFTDERWEVTGYADFFDATGSVPLSPSQAFESGSYVMRQDITSKSDKYVSHMLTTAAIKTELSAGTLLLELAITGSGTVDYYNDDFVLVVDGLSASLGKDSVENIVYPISFMDEKYHLTLNYTGTYVSDAIPDPTKVLVSAPIFAKTGEEVGTFRLYEDDKVEIVDHNGVVIKAAGQ